MAGSFDRMGRPETDEDLLRLEAPTRIDRGPEPRIGDVADAKRQAADESPRSMQTVDDEFPGLYDRTDCSPSTELDSHRPPGVWVADRNPGYPDAPGRNVNCGDCTRACELTWRGIETQAGALTDPGSGGEDVVVMDTWSPGDRVVSDFDDLRTTLESLGPGSSAMVAGYWNHGGGHWFNAVNDRGVIVAVDGQTGASQSWPPTDNGLGFHEGRFRLVETIFVDAGGRHLRLEDLE